jgi:hypothetical protein
VYVRIARFEGVDPDRIDPILDGIRGSLENARSGEVPAEAPDEVRVLVETVARYVQLVDRDTGRLLGLTFCRTEDDLRRADEVLNAMSPDEGGGARTGVELWEVAIDESFG